MAGSTLSMIRAVSVFKNFGQVSLQDALHAASTNPAKLLRQGGFCVDIEPRQVANLVIFRQEPNELQIERVILQGQSVYAKS